MQLLLVVCLLSFLRILKNLIAKNKELFRKSLLVSHLEISRWSPSGPQMHMTELINNEGVSV